MRNRLKLNEKEVRDLEPIDGRDYQVFDIEIAGFAIRVYRSGSKAFTLDYRINGRQRRYKLGAWPEWSTTAARERAKEIRRQIDEGADPLSLRASERTAPKFSDMIDRYIEEHLPRLAPRNASDQISMLRKMVEPEWGKHRKPCASSCSRVLPPQRMRATSSRPRPRPFYPNPPKARSLLPQDGPPRARSFSPLPFALP